VRVNVHRIIIGERSEPLGFIPRPLGRLFLGNA